MNCCLNLKYVPRPSKTKMHTPVTTVQITTGNAIMVFQFLVCDRGNLINLVMVVNHLVNCAVYF